MDFTSIVDQVGGDLYIGIGRVCFQRAKSKEKAKSTSAKSLGATVVRCTACFDAEGCVDLV